MQVAKYLKLINKCTLPIEFHLKFRAKPCQNCDWRWFPSDPDQPGDFAIQLKAGEEYLFQDESRQSIGMSRYRYWAQSLDRNWTWYDDFNKDQWLVDPETGEYKAPNIMTHVFSLTCIGSK